MHRILVWCGVVACLLRPALTRAEPASSKVVLVDPGVPALSHRLREEIESLGFELVIVPEQGATKPLEQSARAQGAVAAIRVSPHGVGAVEMTIVDRATGKIVTRRLAIATPSDPASAELIATRTVELLRASLMELAAAYPARGEVAVTPELRALTPELAPRRSVKLAFDLGPALVHSPGFAPAVDAWAGFTVLAPSGFGATLQLLIPISSAELEVREGNVELDASLYRLGGVLELGAGSRFVGRLQAGAALARLSLSGSADAPYFGAEDDLLAFGPWLGVGLRVELTRSFSLLLGADTAWLYPRTVIRAAGREVATWGRPASAATLGVEVVYP